MQTAQAQGSLLQGLVGQPSQVQDGHAGMESGQERAAAAGSLVQEARLQVQQAAHGLQRLEAAAAEGGWAAHPAVARMAVLQLADVAVAAAGVRMGAADQGAAVVGAVAALAPPVLD